MKHLILLMLTVCISGMSVHAQNFKKQQQAQERTIKAAQRRHSITDREYEKLMNEQYAIQEAIDKATYDGIWTARERNAVTGKLERAAKRIRKYKTNGEVW